MNSHGSPWVAVIAIVIAGYCIGSCAHNSPPVPETEYATKIVGGWQGTVGDSKESMSIDSDGTFICQLHQTGFIANTLSQGVTGTIRGTWKITGAVITLKITGAKNEDLGNKIASSTIVAFRENELVLKSDRGETSLFQRVRLPNRKPK
jgi:hypothetical protein